MNSSYKLNEHLSGWLPFFKYGFNVCYKGMLKETLGTLMAVPFHHGDDGEPRW